MSNALVADLARRRQEYWAEQHRKDRAKRAARVTPRNPIASHVNLDCAREVYLSITNWQDRPDPEPEGAERMADGKLSAAAARRYLEDLGYEVTDVETPIEPFRDKDGRVVFTGQIDFCVVFDGRRIPVEAKETSVFVFDAVDRFEDLDRFWWTRRYKGQILVYLLQRNAPEGIILLTCQGKLKPIPVVLEEHLEDAEAALRLGETVQEAVKAGTPPPFAKDPTTCRTCWAFGRICQPPISEQGASLIQSVEFEQLLKDRADAEAAHRRYEVLDKKVKETIRAMAVDRAICGDFAISVTEVAVKEYTVKARTDRRVKIVRAGAQAKEDVA